MSIATYRFYAELNDFLPPARRGVTFEHAFSGRPSVKDAIESLGVPHAEVDLVLIDGVSVDFSAPVCDGSRVSVFPVFEAIDVGSIAKVRPKPLRQTRFVLDVHLGKLAAYLRMAGFDTCWRKDCCDAELAQISHVERRILLTRDRDLLKRSEVSHGHWMRETRPSRQLAEVLRRFDLLGSMAPFTRCLRCNEPLRPAELEQVAQAVPPRVRQRHRDFRACPTCRRIYWRGTHHQRMAELLAKLESILVPAPAESR